MSGHAHEVELPAGGRIQLQSIEEVELWENSHRRYIEDYHLNKTNDLVILGGLLMQQVLLFRAQRKINGMIPEVDNNNVPTGRYRLDPDQDEGVKAAARKELNEAMAEIRRAEQSLAIDKVSREAGGTVTVEDYIRRLKRAAHDRGIHLNKRFIAYEALANELRTKIRMLRNLDAEDRAYEGVPTADAVLDWAEQELKSLEEADKRYARDKHKLYVGKL
jgi:hypothetical protein